MKIGFSLSPFFKDESIKYLKPLAFIKSIFYFPLFIVPIFVFFIALPQTRELTLSLLDENGPVETFTFLLLLIASIMGFILILSPLISKDKKIIRLLLFFFSFGLFFAAMEEIAWGQQLFKFKTPDSFYDLNAQHELTLHNINSLQGKSEIFRLIFGIGGLLAMLLGKTKKLSVLATPKILLSFFIVITSVTLVDLFADFYNINHNLDMLLQRLSELIELLIAMSGFFYILLIRKRLIKPKDLCLK